MRNIFIYSTSNGQSLKICNALNQNKESLIIDIDKIKTVKLDEFDQIIIGASVKYGDHNKKIYDFIKNNKILLETKKTSFFSVLALYLPQKKKLFMHIVVFIGLIIVLGGLDIIRNVDTLFINFWADISKIMMLISGVFFIFLCIKSFIHARSQ